VLPRAERDTWVSMWSLDKDDGKGAEEAVHRVHKLVLKPQREGGGNNIYRKHPAIRCADAATGARGMGRDGTHLPAAQCRRVSCLVWDRKSECACDE
jgi:hypothetical protein